MAAIPITFLPQIADVDPAMDPLPIVDISDQSQSLTGTTKKIVPNQIIANNLPASFSTIHGSGNLTVGVESFKVDANGKKVGVGTSSPSISGNVGIHVKSTTGPSDIKVESSNASVSVQAQNNTVRLWSDQANTVVIGNSGTARVVVHPDGRTSFADYLESPLFPVISNLFDENTGVYFPDEDQVAISTGGVERIKVDETGKLNTSDDVLVGGNARVNDLTAGQVVFTDGSKYLESKTPVDARTALQTTTYSHTQSVSATPWVVNHNLNAFPTVWVIDPLGRAGWTEVEYINANTLKIYFPGPQTGKAYLNF
jgi:hypothetical protein